MKTARCSAHLFNLLTKDYKQQIIVSWGDYKEEGVRLTFPHISSFWNLGPSTLCWFRNCIYIIQSLYHHSRDEGELILSYNFVGMWRVAVLLVSLSFFICTVGIIVFKGIYLLGHVIVRLHKTMLKEAEWETRSG